MLIQATPQFNTNLKAQSKMQCAMKPCFGKDEFVPYIPQKASTLEIQTVKLDDGRIKEIHTDENKKTKSITTYSPQGRKEKTEKFDKNGNRKLLKVFNEDGTRTETEFVVLPVRKDIVTFFISVEKAVKSFDAEGNLNSLKERKVAYGDTPEDTFTRRVTYYYPSKKIKRIEEFNPDPQSNFITAIHSYDEEGNSKQVETHSQSISERSKPDGNKPKNFGLKNVSINNDDGTTKTRIFTSDELIEESVTYPNKRTKTIISYENNKRKRYQSFTEKGEPIFDVQYKNGNVFHIDRYGSDGKKKVDMDV